MIPVISLNTGRVLGHYQAPNVEKSVVVYSKIGFTSVDLMRRVREGKIVLETRASTEEIENVCRRFKPVGGRRKRARRAKKGRAA